MNLPTPLELEVLRAIATQAVEGTATLNHQIDMARVSRRENTGAGFFTTFDLQTDRTLDGQRSPIGDVGASIEGLSHGMGFLLWVKDGRIHELEGYAYGDESTSALDFEKITFRDVRARYAA
jgi:hypothetical protein